jgi:smad nuclear-interacting protein 1
MEALSQGIREKKGTEEKSKKYEWGNREIEAPTGTSSDASGVEKDKVNFGLSGALTKDDRTGNTTNGTVLKFAEPDDAAIPDKEWRLYVFRGDDLLETMHIHRQSRYLFGRDQNVVDIVTAHPSSSKQHAVLQFRSRPILQNEQPSKFGHHSDSSVPKSTRPYLMDLESTNSTYLNDQPIEPARFYELREKDCFKIGQSSRVFVLMVV